MAYLYFDSAATAPPVKEALEAAERAYTEYGNPSSLHGAGLAAVWGSWARYVCKGDDVIMRFARYGVNVLGLPMNYEQPERTALEAIEATERYFKQIDMPTCISELLGRTLTDDEIKELSVKCTYFGRRKIGGVIKLGESEIAEIYRMANR